MESFITDTTRHDENVRFLCVKIFRTGAGLGLQLTVSDDNGAACHAYARMHGHFDLLLSVRCVFVFSPRSRLWTLFPSSKYEERPIVHLFASITLHVVRRSALHASISSA